MKTLRNKKSGEIQRVDEKSANNMVGISWEFVPKSEWKKNRETPTEKQESEQTKKDQSKIKKKERLEKIKEKQRN